VRRLIPAPGAQVQGIALAGELPPCDWWTRERRKCQKLGAIAANDIYGASLAFCARHWPMATSQYPGVVQASITSPVQSINHMRARRACPPGPCEVCGSSERSQVHHKDGNPQNNSTENLRRLCSACHMHLHHKRPVRMCAECERPVMAHGYCQTHYLRWKRWGDPHLTAIAGNRWGSGLVWRP
jgi:hypothetical protein